MCTAVTYKTKDFYFGRTLDYEFSYKEEVTVTPRNFPLRFRHMGTMSRHYAIIGMAFVQDQYPLYYDAVNEKGLGMAGLNFVGNAFFGNAVAAKDNVPVFEFIAWILSRCATVQQARKLIEKINLTNEPFSAQLPCASLHWLIADREEAITVEAMADGIHIHPNPVGVLTNNPPFGQQLFRLNDYRHLSPKDPENTFAKDLKLSLYSRGMGAMGLPGDLSSPSRFVRAAFVKLNSVSPETEEKSVSQFFHILGAVDQQRGCCDVGEGKFEITIYTSCCNADRGIYYYTTYDNHQITAVDMHKENLDGTALARFPLIQDQRIFWQNESSGAFATGCER